MRMRAYMIVLKGPEPRHGQGFPLVSYSLLQPLHIEISTDIEIISHISISVLKRSALWKTLVFEA